MSTETLILTIVGVVVVSLAILGIKSGVVKVFRNEKASHRIFWIAIAFTIFMALLTNLFSQR